MPCTVERAKAFFLKAVAYGQYYDHVHTVNSIAVGVLNYVNAIVHFYPAYLLRPVAAKK